MRLIKSKNLANLWNYDKSRADKYTQIDKASVSGKVSAFVWAKQKNNKVYG